MTTIVSVACRHCNWGTWGIDPPDRCPYCRRPVIHTGGATVVDIPRRRRHGRR